MTGCCHHPEWAEFKADAGYAPSDPLDENMGCICGLPVRVQAQLLPGSWGVGNCYPRKRHPRCETPGIHSPHKMEA